MTKLQSWLTGRSIAAAHIIYSEISPLSVADLKDSDFEPDFVQKGVDACWPSSSMRQATAWPGRAG